MNQSLFHMDNYKDKIDNDCHKYHNDKHKFNPCLCPIIPPGPTTPTGPTGATGPAGGVLNFADFFI